MSNDLFDHAMHERLKSEAPLAGAVQKEGSPFRIKKNLIQ